jgi:predicted transcriptional regulator
MSPGRSSDAPPPLHELEAEVMEETWRRGEATVRAVLESLNAGPRERAYTTVMTTMSRLHHKRLLGRRREGQTDIYYPTLSRESYRDARARAEVSGVLEEYGDLALAHFARQVEALDPERLSALRRLARGD